MRGGFLHNHCLVEPVAQRFAALGANVYREHRVGRSRNAGYVDLFIETHDVKVVVEAEQCTERIDRDRAKAKELRAHLLIIVAPTREIAMALRRRTDRTAGETSGTEIPIVVATLGSLLQRLGHLSRIEDALNVLQTLNPQIHRRALNKNRADDSSYFS